MTRRTAVADEVDEQMILRRDHADTGRTNLEQESDQTLTMCREAQSARAGWMYLRLPLQLAAEEF